MTSKLKSFFSKQRLILVIAFLLIGTLLTNPITVYSVDSDYIWYDVGIFNLVRGGRCSYSFFVEKIDGLEIVAFSDRGCFRSRRDNTPWEKLGTEVRIPNAAETGNFSWSTQMHELYGMDGLSGPLDSTGFTDYVGIIVKKDGLIVSASLHKMVCLNEHWQGFTKEIAVLEYPFLNCFVTEMHVKSELRKIALIDRIATLDSATDRRNAPSIYSPEWFEWQPPDSPTYNP